MPYSITPKLSNQNISIFSVMSAMAQEENALNLSQGFPDFGIDNQLIEYLHEGENSILVIPICRRCTES